MRSAARQENLEAILHVREQANVHLSDWPHTIDVKLRTLPDLSGLLHQDWVDWWMVSLESTIVLLFLLDVIRLPMVLERGTLRKPVNGQWD